MATENAEVAAEKTTEDYLNLPPAYFEAIKEDQAEDTNPKSEDQEGAEDASEPQNLSGKLDEEELPEEEDEENPIEDLEEELEEDQPEDTKDQEEPEEEDEEESEQRVPYHRLSREVAKRKRTEEKLQEAEERIGKLEERIESSKPKDGEPVPLENLTTTEDLEKFERSEEQLAEWALERIDGEDPQTGEAVEVSDGKGGKTELTRKDILKLYHRANRNLSKLIPARKAYLATKDQADQMAKTTYPDFFDKKTELGKFYQEQFSRYGAGLSRYPEHKMMLALMVRGYIDLQQELKAQKKPSKKKPEIKRQPAPRPRGVSTPTNKPKSKEGKADILEQMAKDPFGGSADVHTLTRFFDSE